jgi:hypothetical protein
VTEVCQTQSRLIISIVVPWVLKTTAELRQRQGKLEQTLLRDMHERFDCLFGSCIPFLLAYALDPLTCSLDFVEDGIRAEVNQELTRTIDDLQFAIPASLRLPSMKACQEAMREFASKTKEPDSSVVDFWSKPPEFLLCLKPVAQAIFSVPPSSAASESAFSTIGFLT